MKDRIRKLLTEYPFTIGLALRLFIAWLLPLLLDDGLLLPGVAYTDIDYHVFTDAANYINQGQSPYQRHTYRYTPFLALILSQINGRYLFCLADALCGKLILYLQWKQSKKQPSLLSYFMWIYNPLAINICTRGSAESFVVLLPVLMTIATATMESRALVPRALLAGILHGIAVHAKVYPIIYSLSFVAYFGRVSDAPTFITSFPGFVAVWVRRCLRPAPLVFALAFVATFSGLTYMAVILYGREALDEGLLYHLTRVDHRHNYSMWWYPIYLARRQTPGVLLMIPQAVLLLVTSLGMDDLGWTLFVQTYLFVTLNKVITAQYFTWYLCLLPLCRFHISKRLVYASLGVGVSMLIWLGSAYFLEMQGLPVHRIVWMASVAYFGANIHLLRVLIASYRGDDTTETIKKKA